MQGYQIQVQTCFRLLEINILISIIIGMAYCTRIKTIPTRYRERENIQLDFIKTQTKMYMHFCIESSEIETPKI